MDTNELKTLNKRGLFICNWGNEGEARKCRAKLIIRNENSNIYSKSTFTILYLKTGPQTHTRTHKYPKNDRTSWSLLRPNSDLPASCGLQGPGPRGRLDPLHDPEDPSLRSWQGEGWWEKTLHPQMLPRARARPGQPENHARTHRRTTRRTTGEQRQNQLEPERQESHSTTTERTDHARPRTLSRPRTNATHEPADAPIIIPPASEGGVPPRDPPSLAGWFWHAKSLFVSLTGQFWRKNPHRPSHWPKRVANPSIGTGAW